MRRFNGTRGILALLSSAVLILLLAGAALAETNNLHAGRPAKYVFFFIGDGVGMPQINAAEIALRSREGQEGNPSIRRLALSSLPVQGMATTYSANSFITDSAPAATSLASGYKTDNGVVGMDPAKRLRFKPMSRMARERGRRVGVVSNVSIDHATPAAFYASVPSRKDYYDISRQLAESGFDYFAGGGFLQPRGPKKDRPDSVEYARSKGYRIVADRDAFLKLRPGVGKVIVFNPRLDDEKAMPYDMDRGRGDEDMTLAELTEKGVELLDNPKGFFLMVEGGKIDWACHANDAAAAIGDTLAFDDAVKVALRFAARHPEETLVVVTGDHECGGMTIGFAGTQYDTFFDKIRFQRGSYQAFDAKLAEYRKAHPKDARLEDLMPLIEQDFGLTRLSPARRATLEKMAASGDRDARARLGMALTPRETRLLEEAFAASMTGQGKADKEETYLVYGGYEPLSVTLTHILNQKAGIGWTSYSHTGVPVPVFAKGVGQALFRGYYDNTDIAKKIMSVLGGFTPTVASAQ
jgi:alkaline phosphatase